jgi:hypothetical protein
MVSLEVKRARLNAAIDADMGQNIRQSSHNRSTALAKELRKHKNAVANGVGCRAILERGRAAAQYVEGDYGRRSVVAPFNSNEK